MVARNTPRSGVIAYRSPSAPSLGSSVTSHLISGQSRMAAAMRLAVPTGPRQPVCARRQSGARGWTSHSRRTGTPSTPATAHSTWGRNAGGHECTNNTPRAPTVTSFARGSASPPASASVPCPGTSRSAVTHCAPSATAAPRLPPVGRGEIAGRVSGMSEKIRIQPLAPHEYAVDVTEGTTHTRHRVVVPTELLDDLGLVDADEERVVRESIEF